MTETTTAGAAKEGGVFEDILEVLWAPATVFERSRSRGAGLYMLVLTLIIVALLVATKSLIQPYVDANFDLQLIKMAEQGQKMPAEAVESGRRFGGYFLFAGWALTAVFSGLIGGVLTWLGAKVASAALPLGRAVFIATLAAVPRVLGVLATAIQGAVLDTSNVTSLFAASVGPARFVDPATTDNVVLTLLASFDLFGLWNIAITAIGVSVIARVSRGAGWLASVVAVAISLLFSLIPAALS
jgi:hypothetical protein